MKSDMIDKIFLEFSQSNDYNKSAEVEHMQNVQTEQGNEMKNIVGEEAYVNTVEDIITISEVESERCGFIMGFKYAMRLMQECLSPAQQNT